MVPQAEREIQQLAGRIRELEEENRILRDSIEPVRGGYRRLMTAMSEGVCIHEMVFDDQGHAADYRILDVNPRFETILGITGQEAVGKLSTEVYKTDEAPYLDLYADVVRTGTSDLFETYFPPMQKYFTISVFPMGKGRFGTIFFDVTQLKLKEKALRESGERLRYLFENTAVGFAFLSATGEFQEVNDKLTQILGYSREELQGVNFLDITYPQDIPLDKRYIDLIQHGELDSFMLEKRYIHKEGRIIWAILNVSVIRDESGEIRYAITAVQDISDMKQTEESRLRTESRFKDIFSNVPVGIFRTTIDGQVLEVNREMAGILGFSDSEEAVRYYTDLSKQLYFDPERRAEFVKLLRENHEVFGFEYEARRADGKRIWISMNARLGTDQTATRTIIDGFAQDITYRRQVEESLKGMIKERESLLRELYHRTKNNMQVIASMLSLKRLKIADAGTREVLLDLEGKIHSMALVHQKLYLSRNLSRIDLKEYIQELGDLVLQTYGVDGDRIEILYELESLYVLIDTAVPIGLVINEVLLNTFKHAFPDQRQGTVQVRLAAIDGDRAEIVISDNGIGFPEKLNWEKPATLGIQTIRNLVENQLGGRLQYDTAGGTVCTIEFAQNLYNERV